MRNVFRARRCHAYLIRKRGIERIEQGRLAERLEQALHGAVREQTRAEGLCLRCAVMKTIGMSLPPMHQFLLQVGARHARHRDVEEQTSRFADDIGREERLGRGKRLGGKAELPHQVGQRLAHGLVVIDDRHQ